MTRPALSLLLTLQIVAFGISGCDSRRSQPVPGVSAREPDTTTWVVRDGIGRQVKLPRHPQRVISLAPSVTEVIYMVGADGRLIGVTNQCDWPAGVSKKIRIGDLLSPNYELILASRPDLIIASTAGNDRAAVLKLGDLGLPVFVTAPRSVEQIFETVRLIGRVTDCAARANELVAQMKNRLEEVRQRLNGLPPTRAFFITWFDPLLAPGKNTFETDVLRQAGVISITADIDEYYPRYSLEQVLAQNPEVILTVEHKGNPLPDLRRLAGWQRLSAVQNGRVYVLPEEFQHPSPRCIDGVEALARKLHPERFQ